MSLPISHHNGGDIAEPLLAFALVSTWQPAAGGNGVGTGALPTTGAPGLSRRALTTRSPHTC